MIKTKILITGAGGFVGRVFYSQLPSDQFVLPESTRTRGLSAAYAPRVVDITQAEAVAAQVAEFKPDVVLHLAAQSHVPTSFSDPLKTWQTNVIGTVNYLTVLQKYAPEVRCFYRCSANYGHLSRNLRCVIVYLISWLICTVRCGYGKLIPSRSKASFIFSCISKKTPQKSPPVVHMRMEMFTERSSIEVM